MQDQEKYIVELSSFHRDGFDFISFFVSKIGKTKDLGSAIRLALIVVEKMSDYLDEAVEPATICIFRAGRVQLMARFISDEYVQLPDLAFQWMKKPSPDLANSWKDEILAQEKRRSKTYSVPVSDTCTCKIEIMRRFLRMEFIDKNLAQNFDMLYQVEREHGRQEARSKDLDDALGL